jgi:hypothetical protein
MGTGANVSYQTTGTLGIGVAVCDSGFMAENIEGIEYPAVDTTAKNVMFTVSNTNLHTFIYKAGGFNNTGIAISRQKALYFKGFSYNEAVLPVSYQSFTAVEKNGTVLLNWITATEVNNNHFIVERSFDGIRFEAIATVNKNAAGKYAQNDVAINGKTVIYYRLKQVDNNGTYTYSQMVTVKLATAGTGFQVSPNPFVERLSIQFNAAQKATAVIRLVSLNGAQVLAKNQLLVKGNNTIEINGLTNLPAGSYVALLVVDGKVAATKTIVK